MSIQLSDLNPQPNEEDSDRNPSETSEILPGSPKAQRFNVTFMGHKFYSTHLIVLAAFMLAGALLDNGVRMAINYYYTPKQELVSGIYYPLWDYENQGMNPSKFGMWETVIPSKASAAYGDNIGMQTVHSVLMPSGKILLFSGSSWRNNQSTQYYPKNDPPASYTGLFDNQTFILTGTDAQKDAKLFNYYNLINNAGVYDPVNNSFFRIPVPLPDVDQNRTSFEPNDFFCAGHIQMPDGNPLVIGGTQLYFPMRTGARTSYLFNWTIEAINDWGQLRNWGFQTLKEAQSFMQSKTNPWRNTGLMKNGRWYPSFVPLTDSTFAVFGGFIGNFSSDEAMFKYQTNRYVEIFNYANLKYGKNPWESAFDMTQFPNSPFTTRLDIQPPAANCSAPMPPDMTPASFKRFCQSYKNDSFKLYPQNYLITKDKIYITQEGDWNSMRQQRVCCVRKTNKTYYMNMIRTNGKITNLTFENNIERDTMVSMSGTTVELDLNNKNRKIYLFGGMQLSTGGTMLPGMVSLDDDSYSVYNYSARTQYAGSRGSRKFQVFHITEKRWEMINFTFLGATYGYDRTMHYSLILPNKQILIIGGGNYDYFSPIFEPLLLTPVFNETTKDYDFKRQIMAPARVGGLYHNVALLMRDGRIFTSGGNACRATVNTTQPILLKNINKTGQFMPNPDRVNVHLYFVNDSTVGRGDNTYPAENHHMEIYSPPYLFIDGDRVAQVSDLRTSKSPAIQKIQIKKEDYYLIKSNTEYKFNASNNNCSRSGLTTETLVLLKLSSSTHGWNGGQKLYDLPIKFEGVDGDRTIYSFNTPSAEDNLIVPAFYNLFYVDCQGKPARSLMVRFDDQATTVV